MPRSFFILPLALLLAGCATSTERAVQSNNAASLGPGGIGVFNEAFTALLLHGGTAHIAEGDTLYVLRRTADYYEVQAEGGAVFRVAPSRVAFGPEAATVTQRVAARARCADFASAEEARAAYAAGETQLDGDGDGIPCEAMDTARSPTSTPAARRGRNCHTVRGHTRTVNGRRVRVRGHTRCR